MNSKILLCLALIMSGDLYDGCSSTGPRSAISKPSTPNLYLHLFASYIYPQTPRLIFSAPVPLSTDFDLPMKEGQHIQGHLQSRSGKYFVYFKAPLCDGTNVFNGEVELEKRYEPWPQPYDAKAPFICQPHFVLSTNSDPGPFLKQQASAEQKQWQLKNPLSPRQLEEVKRRFRRMRPGMTEDEVFAMLGLSAYQHRLLPTSPFLTRFDLRDYQLADGERLMLFFDNTGMKTTDALLAGGRNVTMVDYNASDTSHRHVIRAELDSVTCRSNSPPVWQTALQWP